MFRPRVIPCLLLRNKGLVKTVKFKNARYIGDPINAVRIYNAKQADELVFLDIDASNDGRTPPLALIEKIADEAFMPFTIGGGVRSIEFIRTLLRTGAEKVAINSYAVENPEFIRQASDVFGASTIVVSIDVKKKLFGKYEVYTLGGKKATGLDPVEFSMKMEKLGAGELFINSVDKDGTMEGYDIDIINTIANSVTIPVVACGGAGKMKDLREAVIAGNASAVAAGSFFVYHGRRRAVLINFPTQSELKNSLQPTA